MKLVSYNIQFGRGLDERIDLERTAAVIGAADVVCLQEVDRHWARTGGIDQAERLAELLPDFHWAYGPAIDAPAPRTAGDRSAAARGRRRQHGNMVLARWPLLSTRVFPLPKADPPEFCAQRVALEAVIGHPIHPFRVYSLHLCHIAAKTRLPQVDRLLAATRDADAWGPSWSGAPHEGPSWWTNGETPAPWPADVLLAGDFNFAPDSQEYARMLAAGWIDAWRQLGRDPATEPSVPPRQSETPTRIDHVFASTSLAPRIRHGWIDVEATASDHLPVWVELEL